MINKVITKKFDEWVASITDGYTQALVKQNSIVTGGCIASMLLREPVNDYDVYFTDKRTVKAVAQYYVDIFNKEHGRAGVILDGAFPLEHPSAGNLEPDRIKIFFKGEGSAGENPEEREENDDTSAPEPTTDKKYHPIFLSTNAITLSNQIQIVIRFYGAANEIHDNYDYVHCTNYWTSAEKKLILNQPALESIITKTLQYIGSKYPVASVIRTRKFVKRLWTINAGQYLKMAFQISKLDLTNTAVLEDQLVGVDHAYFRMIIDALSAKTQSDPGFKLNYEYLSEIIDRIFH